MPSIRCFPLFLYVWIVELLSKIKILAMNDEMTQQRLDPNAADSSRGPEIQIEMQNLNPHIPNQYQVHGETSTEATIHQEADVGVEDLNFEVALSLPSENETQAEHLKMGLRVAIWATEIAVGGVIAVLAGFIGNQITSSSHKLFFKASIISMCATFIFGSCILILKILHPSIPYLIVIIKILILAAIGSVAIVVGFGVTIYFRRD